jgi:hypothetical protein
MSFIEVCLKGRQPARRLKYLGLALVLVGVGAAAQEPTFMVLNPTGDPPPVELKPMTARPASLDGKTIFFVDQTFNNADV